MEAIYKANKIGEGRLLSYTYVSSKKIRNEIISHILCFSVY